MTATAASAPAPISRAHRIYILTVMVVIYTSNFIDRSLLGVLGQPIKADLKLQDWQLGMLGGLAFALLYSFAGLGVARIAERTNRVTIISAALAKHAVMTPKAGTPSLSAVTASCRLHDEQLPQSPRPVTTASHCLISATIWASAGAL